MTQMDSATSTKPEHNAESPTDAGSDDRQTTQLRMPTDHPNAKRIANRRDEIELPNSWWYRLSVWAEKKASKLSVRNNFWHRVTSWIWMPLAYRSGIRVHKGSVSAFSALLPFRRFNRNWYKAMAGGALLANSELAGGMFIFQKCSGDWTVVCKELSYKFMRPCFGPAVYNIDTEANLDELIAVGDEFNITVEIEVVQMVTSRLERERRVGICTATFHVTPKTQHRKRKHWKKIQQRQKELEAMQKSDDAS